MHTRLSRSVSIFIFSKVIFHLNIPSYGDSELPSKCFQRADFGLNRKLPANTNTILPPLCKQTDGH